MQVMNACKNPSAFVEITIHPSVCDHAVDLRKILTLKLTDLCRPDPDGHRLMLGDIKKTVGAIADKVPAVCAST